MSPSVPQEVKKSSSEGGGIAEPLRHGVKGGLSRAGEDGGGGGMVEIDGGHDVTSFPIKISLIVVVWGGVVKGGLRGETLPCPPRQILSQ